MENKDKILVTRNASWHRPCNFLGKEIDKIVIYSKGEILYETRSGWLEDNKSRSDIESFEITIPKRANKINLNREDNFYMTGKREWKHDEGYVLYLNADLEAITLTEGEWELDWENEYEERFQYIKEIKFKNSLKIFDGEETNVIKVWTDFVTNKKSLAKELEKLKEKFETLGLKFDEYDWKKIILKYEVKLSFKERKL